MNTKNICLIPFFLVLGVAGAFAAGAESGWKDKFDVSACKWSSTGKNDFFILEPGYQLILEGVEGKKAVWLQITVLNETKKIGGVETRVVEEREAHDGELEEVSLNYFAVCAPANDVCQVQADALAQVPSQDIRKLALMYHESSQTIPLVG